MHIPMGVNTTGQNRCRRFHCRFDVVVHNRNVQRLLPVYPTRRLCPCSKAIRVVTAPLRWTMWRCMEVTFLMHYRLPRRLWPRRRASADATSEVSSIFNPTYMHAVRSGAIVMHVGTVERITTDSVVLKTHSGRKHVGGKTCTIPSDTIVMCTGWQLGLQPLDNNIAQV